MKTERNCGLARASSKVPISTVDAGCKLHERIQWCASKDGAFDVWLKFVFPEKKIIARRVSADKAARIGGKVGRPKTSTVT